MEIYINGESNYVKDNSMQAPGRPSQDASGNDTYEPATPPGHSIKPNFMLNLGGFIIDPNSGENAGEGGSDTGGSAGVSQLTEDIAKVFMTKLHYGGTFNNQIVVQIGTGAATFYELVEFDPQSNVAKWLCESCINKPISTTPNVVYTKSTPTVNEKVYKTPTDTTALGNIIATNNVLLTTSANLATAKNEIIQTINKIAVLDEITIG